MRVSRRARSTCSRRYDFSRNRYASTTRDQVSALAILVTGANEATPFRPRSPYAVAKATAHWLIANYREAYGMHASTGILFNHESPLRPERFVTRKIVATACRIARGQRLRLSLGNLQIRRDWGWAPEYVDAMWRMLQQSAGGDFVIATGQSHSLQSSRTLHSSVSGSPGGSIQTCPKPCCDQGYRRGSR